MGVREEEEGNAWMKEEIELAHGQRVGEQEERCWMKWKHGAQKGVG